LDPQWTHNWDQELNRDAPVSAEFRRFAAAGF